MLTALSIRDIVLIEKLDLSFEDGLSVLSGETGAGKSILLDALGLALGARGDSSLVRTNEQKGIVTASFALSRNHAVLKLLADQGVDVEGELIIRRIQNADGKSRATINDQPVSINLLRQAGGLLAEIHGQHDDRALVDVVRHRDLLDAYGGLEPKVAQVQAAWDEWRSALEALDHQRERVKRAEAERDFLEHAVKELCELQPRSDEEEALAQRRQLMMNAEQFSAAVAEARDALCGDGTLDGRLNAALRKLERRRDQALGKLDELCAALDRVLAEMAEAQRSISEAEHLFAFDPKELEKAEERLFALRAIARKHRVQVGELPDLLHRFEADLQSIFDGGEALRQLTAREQQARAAYDAAAAELSRARKAAAKLIDQAVMAELPPLKLERARFATLVDNNGERAGAEGIDRVEFLVTANPGVPLGPLMKIASGGELARFMLALKVVLAAKGSAPTLIFDEIDTGVGGAVADAMGSRLYRLAKRLQVLCVTHSPQVAARARTHMLISKMEEVGGRGTRMVTRVAPLSSKSRREEIARMLSGASVTDEARAQAERLLAQAG
ncbi:MAG TPA: DNA repair protein RecN [Aestuariivirgaceae bacterium]|nr:DNA repair protein RecN [Aestuariivirgaceae bacterium]